MDIQCSFCERTITEWEIKNHVYIKILNEEKNKIEYTCQQGLCHYMYLTQSDNLLV